MRSASACCGSRRRTSASSPEPSWARSPSDGGDRFSDLDLTFGVADQRAGRRRARRLDAHARRRARRGAARRPRARADHLPRVPAAGRAAVRPLDDAGGAVPSRRAAVPAAVRRDGSGEPELATAAGEPLHSHAAVAHDLFGWGVIYALHARACIERGRVWQAEHYVGAVRDHALRWPASARGCPRCRPAATTTSPPRPSRVRGRPRRRGRAGGAAGRPGRIRPRARARGRGGRALPHADVVAARLAEFH